MLGFKSFTVVHTTYHTTDAFDFVLDRRVGRFPLSVLLARYFVFFFACLTAQQVHGYFDGALLPSRKVRVFNPTELLAYRFLSIKLFVWTYGGDVREQAKTKSLGEPNCCTDCNAVGFACICLQSKASQNLTRVARSATQTFSMGDMTEYTPGSRDDLFFWPVDLGRDNGATYRSVFPEPSVNRPLRVVHAPNHPLFKGTSHLVKAVEELKMEGLEIDLILVQGKANDEALRIYRSADIIFDQCMIGFHGYFALEAMALGKPVMCFIRKPQEYLLMPDECPIINTTRETLKEDLRSFAARRDRLVDIGQKGRSYIEKHYSMEAFAGRLEHAYRDLGIVQ